MGDSMKITGDVVSPVIEIQEIEALLKLLLTGTMPVFLL